MGVAIGLVQTGATGKQSLHWPPGAPVAFAAAAKIGGRVERGPVPDIPAAYWVQWAAGTAVIALVFALALRRRGASQAARLTGSRDGPAPAASVSPPGSPRRAGGAARLGRAGRRRDRRLLSAPGQRDRRCALRAARGALAHRALLAVARRRYAAGGVLLAGGGADAGEPAGVDRGRGARGRAPRRAGAGGGGAGAGGGVVGRRRRARDHRAVAARCSSAPSCRAMGRFRGPSEPSRARRSGSLPSCAGGTRRTFRRARVLDAVAAAKAGSTATPRCAARRCEPDDLPA